MKSDYIFRSAVEKRSYWGDSWDAIDIVAFRTKRQGRAVMRYRATTFNRQWSSKAFLTRECAIAWLYHQVMRPLRPYPSPDGAFRVRPDVLETEEDIAAAFAAINARSK